MVERRLIVHARAGGPGPARVGIAVRATVGGAVVRNRMKRRLRAAAAKAYHVLPPGMDVVIVPRAAAADAAFEELVGSLTELFTRARTGARS